MVHKVSQGQVAVKPLMMLSPRTLTLHCMLRLFRQLLLPSRHQRLSQRPLRCAGGQVRAEAMVTQHSCCFGGDGYLAEVMPDSYQSVIACMLYPLFLASSYTSAGPASFM
jgi:hypothetical protein